MNPFDFLPLDERTTLLLTNLGSIFGILLFIASIITFIYKFAVFVREYAKGFHGDISGIYIAYATNLQLPENDRFIHDIVEFKRSFGGYFVGSVVFSNDEDRNHQIKLKQSKTNPSFYEGQWRNLDDRNTFGYVQLANKEHFSSKTLSGIWTGTTKAEEINGGKWHFQLTEIAKTKDEVLNLLFRQDQNPKMTPHIDTIIQRHLTQIDDTFTYGNISLSIPYGIFNPGLGKVSIELLEEALKHNSAKPEAVLDVGCGSGFYTIYFSKNGTPRVVGTDISEYVLEKAKFNATRNGISTSQMDFRLSSRADPFSCFSFHEKFDLIIANLPFTASELCKEYEGYDLYSAFAGTRKLLVNFILGAQVHLKDNGRIFMSFGVTGYTETLWSVVKLTFFDLTLLHEYQRKDERFQIYMLRFKNNAFSATNE